MHPKVFLRFFLVLVGLGFASHANAGTILDCGPTGAACGLTLSIENTVVASGTYSIDPTTGDLSLPARIGGFLGDSYVSVESINGNADPILGFGLGAYTGAVGNAFSVTMTLPISITGQIIANSSIAYTLTSLSAAGAQLQPLFGNTLIAQELDTSIGGLLPLNKGVDAGNTFFFLGGPMTNVSPVYTASNVFAGSLQYDLMSITVAYSLSPNTSVGLSGFVQQLPVPEPSTGLLLGLGIAVLAWRRSR